MDCLQTDENMLAPNTSCTRSCTGKIEGPCCLCQKGQSMGSEQIMHKGVHRMYKGATSPVNRKKGSLPAHTKKCTGSCTACSACREDERRLETDTKACYHRNMIEGQHDQKTPAWMCTEAESHRALDIDTQHYFTRFFPQNLGCAHAGISENSLCVLQFLRHINHITGQAMTSRAAT